MTNQDWLILNIDDEQAIRYAKTRALQRGGYNVMDAASGSEGLACVEKYRPVLVLCDVKLPDMNGLEVCRVIKERFPGTLVLQVSASFVTSHDRAAGLEHGADSYLTEPIEPDELVASVRALLRMKEYENSLMAANARREFVHSLTERQRSLSAPDVILSMTVKALAIQFRAMRVGFYRLEDGENARFLACWSNGVLPVRSGNLPLTEIGEGIIDEYKACRTVVTSNIGTLPAAAHWGDYSAIGVPLLRYGGWEATMFINAESGRKWGPEEVSLAEEIAQSTWDTVERVQATQRLRELNISLEEGLAERTRALTSAEAQLRQAQKMEAVGQLTGGIAHDFNNLLTGIIGGIDMIRRRLKSGRVDDVDRFMDEVGNSARRAASLTHRLLAFSRRQSLDFKPVDINVTVAALADLLRRTVGESIELRIEPAADLWPAVTDVSQLETALLNLVINARDAMPDGGILTISTENASVARSSIEGLDGGDYVITTVRDTGTGMPRDVIDRAFDPFFTTKPIGQGTGLGLSMVYGFAKQIGGGVTIDSEIGRGTTVQLYMPRSSSALNEDLPKIQAAHLSSDRGETILLAEDDPGVRLLLADLLKELGYQAIVTTDGQRAAEILQSDQPVDLLISDVGLPVLNGRQVAEIGRMKRPDMKILFVTGYAEAASVRSGFLPKGADIVVKPFELDALAAKIKEILTA